MHPAQSWHILLAVAGAYLLGSIPNGLLIAKTKGVDLRRTGSGNIGATNVFRCVGKSFGILALFLDAAKGFIPAFVFPRLLEGPPNWLALACGIAAVAGHTWPVWLGFKGGKGVATSAGMLLGIAPAAVGLGLLAFAITLTLTRYASLGSIVAAVVVPTAYAVMDGAGNPLTAIVFALMGLLVIYKHRTNIGRLRRGQEPRLWGK
ncbi:MAG: glycerol-3-phosphate 1-O-acyltransferase PlsY [Kiritimatiellia bacterium]|jgi:glycerol-3-phosphate acyltransferase PlsY|nr:glycerol-3-phosphate 1-O-acyltransferase PlsY [Lentisphaerota bacterium]